MTMPLESSPEYRPVRTADNAPPFIDALLLTIRPDTIDEREFETIVRKSAPYEENWLLTAMVREVDVSGFVPYLIGSSRTAEDSLVTLLPLAQRQLDVLATRSPDLQDEVFAALSDGNTTIRALTALDAMQANMLDSLHQAFHGSRAAGAFRESNRHALRHVLTETWIVPSLELFQWGLPGMPVTLRKPRITYAPVFRDGALTSLKQQYAIPDMPQRALLEQITPQALRRNAPGRDDPSTPIGLLRTLGKVGHPLPRAMTEAVAQIRKKQHDRNVEMEETIALHEWLSHLP